MTSTFNRSCKEQPAPVKLQGRARRSCMKPLSSSYVMGYAAPRVSHMPQDTRLCPCKQ